jgi:hypothetical protein
MATTTVANLIARAQAASDQYDNFVTTAQWLSWVNVFNKQLAVMVAQLGYPYHQYDETITITGSSTYTVDEPLAILGLYRVREDGKLKKLKLMNPVEGRVLGSATSGEAEKWWIQRNTDNDVTISVYPVPPVGSLPLLLLAIEMPSELDIDDSVKYPLGWEEFIVLSMAEAALGKEETINPTIEKQLAKCVSHIQSSAANYIMASAPKIRNIKDENSHFDYTEPGEWLWI